MKTEIYTKIFLSLISIYLLLPLFEANADKLPDLKKFKPYRNKTATIFSETFDGPTGKLWQANKHFKIIPNEGINGTGALFHERKSASSYQILSIPVKLEKGQLYKVSFSFRLEGFQKPFSARNIEFGAVEFSSSQRRYCGGGYSNNRAYKLKSHDWQNASFVFQPSEKMKYAFIRFYMAKKCTGKIWWDNFRIENIGKAGSIIYDISPSNLKLDKDGKISFAVIANTTSKITNNDIALLVKSSNGKKLLRGSKGIYTTKLEKICKGKNPVKAYLLDLTKRNIIGEENFCFYYSEQGTTAPSSIDLNGRVYLNGKPFLPIGLFGNTIREDQIKQIADGGFNCYMPYTAMRMCPDGKNRRSFKYVDKSMDLFTKHNLKLLFSLKDQLDTKRAAIYNYQGIKGLNAISKAMVNRYKNHPALLSWYLSDENPREEVGKIKKLRELVNANDPNHFTVTLTFNISDMPYFASTGDVLAVDIYPIMNSSPKQSMKNLVMGLEKAHKLKKATWVVVQAFNWGCLRAKLSERKKYKEYRWPTQTEMRSTALAGAIKNARGFLFYSYDCIFKLGEKYEPGISRKVWNDMLEVVKVLKELEPFILSTNKGPKHKILKTLSGEVDLKTWNDNSGKTAAAVIGINAGKNEAVFFIKNQPDLKSKYGLTENLGNGKYRFKGNNISSDVLY